MSLIIQQATAQQRLAARPDHHIHVEANAGSGKTRVLVNRVARLLISGSPPDKILCLTYTKAAAGEMKSRLFKTLGSWSIADDDALTEKLNDLYDYTSGSYAPEALAEARRLFARALETPGGLAVQTIHAFCQSLLQRFPLEAGLPPGFEVADDTDQRDIAAMARRGMLLAAQTDPALLDALRLLAARSVDALDLVIRVAAANRPDLKTLLEARNPAGIDHRLRRELGLDPDATQDAALKAAWRDTPVETLRSAAEIMLTGSATDQKSAQLLLEALECPDPQVAFELMDGVYFTRKGTIRTNLVTKAIRETYPTIDALLTGEAERLLALRERLAAIDLAESSRAAMRICAAYLERYESGLRRRHRLDYADLIASAVGLLRDSDARDWVRYKLDAGIDHVLVDEAQDNAPEQWHVIRALVEEYFAGSGIEHERLRTVFTVGDEKQSIYSFQGAEPKQFLAWGERTAAKAQESGQKFEQPALSVSFRSSPVILAAVDAAFEPERQLGEIKAVTQAPEVKFVPEGVGDVVYTPAAEAFERYQTHQAAWPDRPGRVEIWPALPRIPEVSEPDPAAPVDRDSAASAPHRLAALVADEIRRILDDGDSVYDQKTGGPRAALPKDILVLVARRSGFFRELIRQLKLRAVPVAGADRMVLMDELAVQDLINLAEVALNPLDDLKLAELLKTPFFDPTSSPAPIDEEVLFKLAYERGDRVSLWSRLRDSEEGDLTEIRTAIERARKRIETAGVYGFFADFLNERSDTGETRQKRLFARLGEEARDPVEELLARAIAFEQQSHASLHGFVSAMKAGSGEIKREMDEGRGEVRVMTVHGSKGLEAPIVILPDTTHTPMMRGDRRLYVTPEHGIVWAPGGAFTPGIFETLSEADKARSEGEHTRLLYVALTRASDRLLVCGWQRGRGEGRVAERSWYGRLNALWTGPGWAEMKTPVTDVDGAPLAGRSSGQRVEKLDRPEASDKQVVMPGWALGPANDESRITRTVAPSHLADEPEPAVMSPLIADDGKRFRRGALIHKLLETLPDLPADRRASAAAAYLQAQTDLDAVMQAVIAQETLAVLDHPDFAAVFGPGSLAEVSLTGSAPGLPEGVVLNGQVDRLVVTDRQVLIVDYKTNRPPPTNPLDVPRLYLAQMAAYQALMRSIHPDKQVRCLLLWTDGPHLMELGDEALAKALVSGVSA